MKKLLLVFFIFIHSSAVCNESYLDFNQIKTIFKNHGLKIIALPSLFFLWFSYTKIKKIVDDRALGPLKSFDELDTMAINNKNDMQLFLKHFARRFEHHKHYKKVEADIKTHHIDDQENRNNGYYDVKNNEYFFKKLHQYLDLLEISDLKKINEYNRYRSEYFLIFAAILKKSYPHIIVENIDDYIIITNSGHKDYKTSKKVRKKIFTQVLCAIIEDQSSKKPLLRKFHLDMILKNEYRFCAATPDQIAQCIQFCNLEQNNKMYKKTLNRFIDLLYWYRFDYNNAFSKIFFNQWIIENCLETNDEDLIFFYQRFFNLLNFEYYVDWLGREYLKDDTNEEKGKKLAEVIKKLPKIQTKLFNEDKKESHALVGNQVKKLFDEFVDYEHINHAYQDTKIETFVNLLKKFQKYCVDALLHSENKHASKRAGQTVLLELLYKNNYLTEKIKNKVRKIIRATILKNYRQQQTLEALHLMARGFIVCNEDDEMLNFNSLVHNFFAIAQNLTFDWRDSYNLFYLHAILQRIFEQNNIQFTKKTIECIVQFQSEDHNLFTIKLHLLLRFFGEDFKQNPEKYINYRYMFFKKVIFDGVLVDGKIYIKEIRVDDILEKCCDSEGSIKETVEYINTLLVDDIQKQRVLHIMNLIKKDYVIPTRLHFFKKGSVDFNMCDLENTSDITDEIDHILKEEKSDFIKKTASLSDRVLKVCKYLDRYYKAIQDTEKKKKLMIRCKRTILYRLLLFDAKKNIYFNNEAFSAINLSTTDVDEIAMAAHAVNQLKNYTWVNLTEVFLPFLWKYFLTIPDNIIFSKSKVSTHKGEKKHFNILEGFYTLVDMYKNEKYAIDTYYYPQLRFGHTQECNTLFQEFVIENNQNLWKMMIMLDDNAHLHGYVAGKGILQVLIENKKNNSVHQLIDFTRLHQKNDLLAQWVDDKIYNEINGLENKNDLEPILTTLKETRRYLDRGKNV